MKKFLFLMGLIALFSFALVPNAYAEEGVDEPAQETTEFEEVKYSYDVDGEKGIITLISDNKCVCEDKYGVYLITTYTIEGDSLILAKSDGELRFTITENFELEFVGFFELPSEIEDEKTDFEEVTYYLYDEDGDFELTLLSPTEARLSSYNKELDMTGVLISKYVVENGVIIFSLGEGEYYKFILNEEGNLEWLEDEVVDEPVVETPVVEDEVTFSDQIEQFIDEWFTPIISALAGITGSIAMILVFANKVKKLTLAIKESKELSDKERQKNEEELAEAKLQLEQAKQQALDSATNLNDVIMTAVAQILATNSEELDKIQKASYETRNQLSTEVKTSLVSMLQENKALTEEVKRQNEDITKLKELLVLSISANPSFATNKHGQQMLALLDNKKVV